MKGWFVVAKAKKHKSIIKKSQNRQEYEKQLRRINTAVRRLEKRGYIVDKDYIKSRTTNKLRITKEYIEKLKRITPDVIRYHSEIVDKETGEVIKATNITKKQRKTLKEIEAKNTDVEEAIIQEVVDEKTQDFAENEPSEYDYLEPRNNTPASINILFAIQDRIENMTRKMPMYADPVGYGVFPEWKNILLKIIDDNVMSAEVYNDIQSLYNYYEQHSPEIFTDIDAIEELYYEKALPSFTRLCSILNKGSFPDNYSSEIEYAYNNMD